MLLGALTGGSPACLTPSGGMPTAFAQEKQPPSGLQADDQPSDKPSRADRLKAIRDDYHEARDELAKAIRSGTIKPDADGTYPGWTHMRTRFAKQALEVIEAAPADAVALDALVFCLSDLGAGDAEPALYQLVLKHHAASAKIEPLLRLRSAPADFLRNVAAKTPHPKLRLWAHYHLAENLYASGQPKEAEPLLEALGRDEEAKKLGGYVMGRLADTANRLLFEVRRLNVGQEVPEIAGPDLDGKAMKLSECRGQVTLLVFWATWCEPCMAMVPHERALAERYAGKPFIIVGVNGDTLADENFQAGSPDGMMIDDTAKVRAVIEKHKIAWRSFRNGQFGIGMEWNVRSWPTVFLIDHRGIIRGKWKGSPGEKELDAAVEDLVKIAEAEKDETGK
jgi:thiol-disulfide isomerase/thioredoxin